MSIRRACACLRIDTSLYHYKSKRGDQAALKARIKEITATRVRYGYRRVHVLLRREGWAVNAKRIYRLYMEMGLQIRNKTPKRRVKAKLREDRVEAVHSNDVWVMDFVHDQLATGQTDNNVALSVMRATVCSFSSVSRYLGSRKRSPDPAPAGFFRCIRGLCGRG